MRTIKYYSHKKKKQMQKKTPAKMNNYTNYLRILPTIPRFILFRKPFLECLFAGELIRGGTSMSVRKKE